MVLDVNKMLSDFNLSDIFTDKVDKVAENVYMKDMLKMIFGICTEMMEPEEKIERIINITEKFLNK